MKIRSLLFSSAGVLSLACALPAHAQFSVVASRPALSATDSVDWFQFAQFSSSATSPANGFSTNALPFTISNTNFDNFQFVSQGGTWFGNFATGDSLLWISDTSDTLTIDFGSDLLHAAGLQIQQRVFGPFTAQFTALDHDGNVLFSSSLVGDSNGNGDNSALFVGVESDSQPFARLQITLGSAQDFAVNRLDFRTASAAAPEPTSLALLTLAGIGLITRRRR